MEILSGFDIMVKKKKSKYPEASGWTTLMQPIQFVEDKDKTMEWASATMNFMENQGMIQLRRNLNWMNRNYQLINNEIDKRDYIKDKDNEYFEMINRLTDEGSATELKSVPFIQLIVNSLCNEYDKRPPRISFSLLDDTSMDEMFQDKEEQLEKILLAQAAIKQQNKLMEMGLTSDSQQGQQMLSDDTLKSLPELQDFYENNYRSMYQEWAEHQMKIDDDRFYFNEVRRECFKDTLTVDRAFLHLYQKENDYDAHRWNPKQVYYRKSPGERWVQNGQWVGHLDLMNVPDVLDMYGWMMTEEQQLALNRFYPAQSAAYAEDGLRPENMWNPSMSYEYNRTGPGIAARQLYSALGLSANGTGDIVNQLFSSSEDIIDTQWTQLVRVSTQYWKTQRKVYELTTVDADGNMKRNLVSSDFEVTDKPLYNTLNYKEKTSSNVVFGQHLDAIWINEVWGGIKIGPNLPVYGWAGDQNNLSPIYLGIRGGKPSKLPFQFCAGQGKDISRWKPLLPVCGTIYNDENSHSRSLVDNLKYYQIGVNMTANQMLDLMIDELGVIITLDPTAFPKHSLGEDWGTDPFAKGIQVMRDFSIVPQVKQYNENGQMTNPDHVKVLDASQSQRFVTKMKLHDWFMDRGLAAVGLNPQRLGQAMDKIDTATGIEQGAAASYSTTEHLYTGFDQLLVRFHKMRTDLAQYYNSTNPSVRLQYTTSTGMKKWFEMDGKNLDSRDFGVQCVSSPHTRHLMEEIKKMVLKNNTTNTSMTDLVRLYKSDTEADMDAILKSMDQKQQQAKQQQIEQEQQAQQQEQQAKMQAQQQQQQYDAQQKQLDRENKLEVAQVMISPKIADAGNISDNTNQIMHEDMMHNDKMDLERKKEANKVNLEQEQMQIQRQKINEESKRTAQMLHNKAKPTVKKK